MGLELVDAGAGLEAENHNVEILGGQRERVLPAQLARVAEAGLGDKELLRRRGLVARWVELVHAYEAVVGDRHELEGWPLRV